MIAQLVSALAQESIVSYLFPYNSRGSFKIEKLRNRHRFVYFLVSLNQIQYSKAIDSQKNFGQKKKIKKKQGYPLRFFFGNFSQFFC